MRILVTGSEGTLGRGLVKRLQDEGHEVYRCDLQHGEGILRADVASYRELVSVFGIVRPEVVYHLAAEFGRHNGEGWYERVWQTNAIGTRNVLEMCRFHGSELIFASSSEVYGEVEAEWLSEDLSESVPLLPANEYALSKWVNEVQIRNFSARHDMPKPIICRFFNAYGPGERFHNYRSVVALFCHRALSGEGFTVYRDYHRTFMYIDDFIPTLAAVKDRGQPGAVYNIGGRDYRSVEELAQIVLRETGCHPSAVTYQDQDAHNVVSKRPDIARAEFELGHNPQVTLEVGVPKTLAWIQEN